MIALFLVGLDFLIKILFQPTLFFIFPFLLIFFLKANKNFFLTFIFSTIFYDLFFHLYLGFSGLIIGAFFIFVIILKKFFNLEEKSTIFFLNVLMQLIYLISLLYFLKLYSLNVFLHIFLLNLIISTFVIFIYRIFF